MTAPKLEVASRSTVATGRTCHHPNQAIGREISTSAAALPKTVARARATPRRWKYRPITAPGTSCRASVTHMPAIPPFGACHAMTAAMPPKMRMAMPASVRTRGSPIGGVTGAARKVELIGRLAIGTRIVKPLVAQVS